MGEFKLHSNDDTIAAIATAYGEGGIGIVRISGSEALPILQGIFMHNAADFDVSEIAAHPYTFENRKMTYGKIIDTEKNTVIDEVLAVFMKGPNTYTCDDVVEINCHGSMISLRKILALVLSKGARLADKGEFTKRAFLNGRLDLSQAEAVIDVIEAKTDSALQFAVDQLDGKLSGRVRSLRDDLMNVLVDMAVNIDYPDEDIELVMHDKLAADLTLVLNGVEELLSSAGYGRIVKDGVRVAIVGKPNVGKSSLLNALLRYNRAIVTDIPGTTRDVISEFVNINDIPVHLIDTAGIRETSDVIEQIGIDKSRESLEDAELVLLVLDGSQAFEDEDLELMQTLGGKDVVVVINKSDLGQVISQKDVLDAFGENAPKDVHFIETSFTTGVGAELVEEAISSAVLKGNIVNENSCYVANARQEALLKTCANSLRDSIEAAQFETALEIIEIDVRDAYEALGEILGEVLKDDIIDTVFERFCLGK